MDEDFGIAEQPAPQKSHKKAVTALISLCIVAVLAVITALLIKNYVIATFEVDGASMQPNLYGGETDVYNDGEVLLLNRLAKIKRGNIVVFKIDYSFSASGGSRNLVKRVIGIAGDNIKIKNDGDGSHAAVYLNGAPLDEPYINGPMFPVQQWTAGEIEEAESFGASVDYPPGQNPLYVYTAEGFTVPEGYIFCMGDNRNNSSDSRDPHVGPVSLENVVGRCIAVLDRRGGIRIKTV